MKHTLTCFITLLLLCYSSRGFTQQSSNFNHQIVVADRPGIAPVQHEILKILSLGSGKPIRNTLFTVNADQTMRNGYSNGVYTFGFINQTLNLNGDIFYRNVNVSQNLTPQSVQFKLRVFAPGLEKEFKLTSQVTNFKIADVSTTFRDTLARDYRFSVPVFTLNYTNDDLRKLKDKVAIVDEYYKSTMLLDQHFHILNQIDPYDYGGFRTLFSRLDAAQKIYNEIVAVNYIGQLGPSDQDPAKLTEKLFAYNGMLQSKKSEATTVFSTLHLVFYSRGTDFMRSGDYQAARDLFYSSLDVNPAFAPAMLQLARIDFIRYDYEEARCKSDEVLFRMIADPATRANAFDLLRSIHEAYLDLALTSSHSKQFSKSLNEYQKALEICKLYTDIRCTDEVYKGIKSAHQGIYSQLLQEARSGFSQRNISLAEAKVAEAIRYHSQHLSELGQPVEAYELRTALQQKRYEDLVLIAKQAYERGNLDKSIAHFISADSMQQAAGLTVSTEYDKFSKLAGRAYINELLMEGETSVKLNKLSAARNLHAKSVDLQKQFYLGADNALTERANELRDKIYGQECINAQYSIDSATAAGRLHNRNQDYRNAMYVLEAGLDVKRNNPNCKVYTDSLEALLQRIRPAGTYLDHIYQSERNMQQGNHRQALENYISAGNIYAQQNVSSFGIAHNANRDDYVLKTGNNGLLNYIAEQDMAIGNLDNSLRLYKILLSRNHDVKMLNGSLYQLGLKTGKAEKMSAPNGKAKSLAARYTGGDKKLKRFEKGFVKGYK